MERFWQDIFTCCGQKVNSDSEDKINEEIYKLKSVEERRRKKDQTKEKNVTDTTFTRHDNGVINESPKVIISEIKLKEQYDFESDVFAGTLNKRAVAIKVIKKEFNSKAIQESELLLKLDNHESVIKFHFKFEYIDQVYIVTEYYETSLEDYVQMAEEDKDLSDNEICLQLTEAMDFIHKQKVLYLNLNPQNIHLVNVGSLGIRKVKLTNFSSAKQWTRNFDRRDDFALLDGFVAPEHQLINEKQNFTTDIYMLGCIFYYIITNGLKLPNIIHLDQQSKLLGTIQRYQAKHKSSDVVLCLDIAFKMLRFKKKDRTSIDLILKHPFFWSTEKLLNYIIDVAVKLEEKDKTFVSKLEAKRKSVVGNDWTKGLEDVYEDISNKRDYDGSSVVDLVKAIRNRIVHASSSRVIEVMGSSKEDLKNYWLEMFPHLIPHLYQTMNAHYG